MKKTLLKDIVIPKGTVFHTAPSWTKRYGDCHYETIVGLSKNTSGNLVYCIDEVDELKDYFE